MKIQLVTFTGADESVKPEEILRCAEAYPHIKTEWALLLSKSNEGKMRRYPALPWMQEFINQAIPYVNPRPGDNKFELQLAGHLQGHWLRTMCAGKSAFPADRPTLWPYLQRIQLNFHGIWTAVEDGFYTELHEPFKQFIFQMDGVNEDIYHQAVKTVNIVPLFDLSAGEGIVPESWPKPVHPTLNGYAGGLGPDNIKEQLKRLQDTVGDATIWIDMETRIRSEDNQQFDLDRCRRVLDAVGELK